MEYRSCGKGLAEMLVLFYFPKFVYSTVLTLTKFWNVTRKRFALKILEKLCRNRLTVGKVRAILCSRKVHQKQGKENAKE